MKVEIVSVSGAIDVDGEQVPYSANLRKITDGKRVHINLVGFVCGHENGDTVREVYIQAIEAHCVVDLELWAVARKAFGIRER